MWDEAKNDTRIVGPVLLAGIVVICILFEYGGEVCRWIYEVAK